MPWKNGQGVTAEIAISPDSAKFPQDEFIWRLSSATIKAANTFSQFEKCDRLLAVWKGEGLVLNDSELLPFTPFQFSGEQAIECRLINDEVVDLGLIYRRDQVSAEMKVLTLVKTSSQTLSLRQGVHFLVCAEGTFSMSAKGQFSVDTIEVMNEDTFLVEGACSLELVASEPTKIFFISIYDKK